MLGGEQPIVRRVVVLGSSIGLVVRPKREGPPYPHLLERTLNERSTGELWLVENRSEVVGIADDLGTLVRQVTATYPDVVVLHYGRVEALRRPHSRRFWRRTYLRRPDLRPSHQLLRTVVFRPYSAARHYLHVRRQWTPLRRFERVLDRGITFLLDETQARLILIEASPVTLRVEQYGPGSIRALDSYNAVLRQLADRHGIELVRLEDIVRRDPALADVELLTPDGTHYSAQTHAAVAAELAERIETLAPAPAP